MDPYGNSSCLGSVFERRHRAVDIMETANKWNRNTLILTFDLVKRTWPRVRTGDWDFPLSAHSRALCRP